RDARARARSVAAGPRAPRVAPRRRAARLSARGRRHRLRLESEAETAHVHGLIGEHAEHAAPVARLEALLPHHLDAEQPLERGDSHTAERRPPAGDVEERTVALDEAQVPAPELDRHVRIVAAVDL